MPPATSFGLDWPIMPKRRETKLAASAVREVTECEPTALMAAGASTALRDTW